MSEKLICPHCGLDMHKASVVQIVEILQRDSRLDIYEIGDPKGKGINRFTICYSNGHRMPEFSREIAEQVAATGIVTEDPNCKGWFRRTQ